MTETEKKALALVNEVRTDRGWSPNLTLSERDCSRTEALCRAIEQHEAFRQEVSDAVEAVIRADKGGMPYTATGILSRFILPKSDPLVEAMNDSLDRLGAFEKDEADRLRAALAARGLEVRKIGEGE